MKIRELIYGLIIILLSSIMLSCNLIGDQNSDIDDSLRIKGHYKEIERSLSKDDEKRVFENIDFGISKKAFYKLVPKHVKRLGRYDFEFHPQFDHNDQLYRLNIYGADLVHYGDHGAKKYLIDIITDRYGEADSVEVDYNPFIINNNIPIQVYLEFPLFRYYWYLGDKEIWISESVENDQDYNAVNNQQKRLMSYPFLSISSQSRSFQNSIHEGIQRIMDKENDANKF